MSLFWIGLTFSRVMGKSKNLAKRMQRLQEDTNKLKTRSKGDLRDSEKAALKREGERLQKEKQRIEEEKKRLKDMAERAKTEVLKFEKAHPITAKKEVKKLAKWKYVYAKIIAGGL